MAFQKRTSWSDEENILKDHEVRPLSGKKHRRGSAEYMMAQQQYAPGPVDLEQLLLFPTHMVRTICTDSLRKERLLALLQHGVQHSSDYSGIGAEREALRCMTLAIASETGMRVPHMHTRSCDIDLTAQKVLCHIAETEDNGRTCVFPDILKQVDPLAQQWLSACHVDPEAGSAQRQANFEDMRDWLLDNGPWAVTQAGHVAVLKCYLSLSC